VVAHKLAVFTRYGNIHKLWTGGNVKVLHLIMLKTRAIKIDFLSKVLFPYLKTLKKLL
jgi:hypothetical protein